MRRRGAKVAGWTGKIVQAEVDGFGERYVRCGICGFGGSFADVARNRESCPGKSEETDDRDNVQNFHSTPKDNKG